MSNTSSKNRNIIVVFSFIIFILFFYVNKTNYTLACSCNLRLCWESVGCPASWPQYGRQVTNYSGGNCTDSSLCYFETHSTSGYTSCSNCYAGYGSNPAGSSYCDCCKDSCGGPDGPDGPNGPSCDEEDTVEYSCDPSETNKLSFKMWQKASEYDSDNLDRADPNYVDYADDVSFVSERPSGFCDNDYVQEFTGFIYIPGGEWEFALHTDITYSVDGQNPEGGYCCRANCSGTIGNCNYCCGVNCGCGYGTKAQCKSGNWCCRWEEEKYNYTPRCTDNDSNNTGMKLGFVDSGGVLSPFGTIESNLGVSSPGVPSGLTTIISSATGVQDTFTGDFIEGYYPIQVWYTVSDDDDVERLNLWWKDITGGGDWEEVSSSSFMPCGIATTEETSDLKGYLWETPVGGNCSLDPTSNKFLSSDIDINSLQSIGGGEVFEDPGFTDIGGDHNFVIEDIKRGDDQEVFISDISSKNDPIYDYKLACFESETGTVNKVSDISFWYEADDDVEKINLGYKKVFPAWMQIIGGDALANCNICIDSISMRVPDESSILGGFSDSLISDNGSLFSKSDFSIKNNDGVTKLVADDNKFYAKHINDTGYDSFMLDDLSFDPPRDAVEINSNCSNIFNSNLSAGSTYEADIDCVLQAVTSLNGSDYKVSGQGIAVLYVTGDTSKNLLFDKNFRSQNQNRIVFVSKRNINIGEDVGSSTIVENNLDPHIQASLISKGSITVLSNGSGDNNDLSVVMEGPLVTKEGPFSVNRNRGVNNSYPTVVVKLNSDYVDKVEDTNLSKVDIVWKVLN